MAGINFGARVRLGEERRLATFVAPDGNPTVYGLPKEALTGAVGRSHTTPTPDPDSRDSGPRTPGALRLERVVSHMKAARR